MSTFSNTGMNLDPNVARKTLKPSVQSGSLANELDTQVGQEEKKHDLDELFKRIQDYVVEAGQISNNVMTSAGKVKDGFMLGNPANISEGLSGIDNILGSVDLSKITEFTDNLTADNLLDKLNIDVSKITGDFNLNEVLTKLKSGNLIGSIGGLFGGLLGVDINLSGPLGEMANNLTNSLIGDFNLEFGFDKMTSILQEKLMGFIGSKLYIPEVIYLATIKPMIIMGADTKYQDEWLRYKVVLRRDFEQVLSWLDSEEKYSYDVKRVRSNCNASTTNSSVNCTKYILNKLRNDYVDLNSVIVEYEDSMAVFERQLNEIVISRNSLIEREVEKIKADYANNPELYGTTEARDKAISDANERISSQVTDEDINARKSKYINEKRSAYDLAISLQKTYRKEAIRVVKDTIVRSYSNLTVRMLESIMKIFDVKPSFFGEYDDEFNGAFMITDDDINYLAPMVNKKNSNYDISFSLNNNDYINPLNNNIKKIYIYLTSKEIHGTYAMIHKPLYDRLSYPIMSLMDELGREAIDFGISLNEFPGMEDLIYNYTVFIEKFLYNPRGVMELRGQDNSSLPKPLDSFSEEEKLETQTAERLSIAKEEYSKSESNLINLINLLITMFNEDIEGRTEDKLEDKYDGFYENVNKDLKNHHALLSDINKITASMMDEKILSKTKPIYFKDISNIFASISNYLEKYQNLHYSLETGWFIKNESDDDYKSNIILIDSKKEKVWETLMNEFANADAVIERARKYSISIDDSLKRYKELYGSDTVDRMNGDIYDNTYKKTKPLFTDKNCYDINLDHKYVSELIQYELRTGIEKINPDDFSQIMPSVIYLREAEYNAGLITKLSEQ